MIIRTAVFLIALAYAKAQKREGDTCVEKYTSTVGRCKPAESCESARNDFQLNGIRPTFCTYSAFGVTLVCCRDGVSILHTAEQNTPPPIWHSEPNRQSDTRRVSERKCEEYSRGVVEKVAFIPLLPTPETMSITSAKCDYTGVELIVGGENAVAGEFPHMAAIGWASFNGSYEFKCGGSLISPNFVLTVGHCSRDPRALNPEPVIVRLGDQNIDPSVQDGANPIEVPIKKIHNHPDYKPPNRYNDISLFELSTAVGFEATIRPACLWSQPDFGGNTKALATGWGSLILFQELPRVTSPQPLTRDISLFELSTAVGFEATIRPACLWSQPDFGGNTKALATGWGVVDTVTKQTAKELQKVSLSLLSNERCDELLLDSRNRHWRDGFAASQLCAGELRGGRDTCQGDSGSPLQVTQKDNQCIFRIVGLTSFGRKCAATGRPAVYTRVSSFLPWIESVVWPGE